MSKLSTGTASGLLVMVTALIAIGVMANSPAEPTPSTTTLAPVARSGVVEVTPQAIEGLDGSIQRVLESNGKLQTFDPDSVSSLAPEVARVLSYYGATLVIPDTGGSDS